MLDTGMMQGISVYEIRKQFPDEFEQFIKDPLRYRFLFFPSFSSFSSSFSFSSFSSFSSFFFFFLLFSFFSFFSFKYHYWKKLKIKNKGNFDEGDRVFRQFSINFSMREKSSQVRFWFQSLADFNYLVFKLFGYLKININN